MLRANGRPQTPSSPSWGRCKEFERVRLLAGCFFSTLLDDDELQLGIEPAKVRWVGRRHSMPPRARTQNDGGIDHIGGPFDTAELSCRTRS
jgi:hypothetical protein